MSRQVALVTGGSRGLGGDLIRALLKDGYAVATYSRTRTPLIEECAGEYERSGAFLWSQIDGTDLDAVRTFVARVAKEWNGIDILVNNAAVGLDGLLPLAQADKVDYAMALNLRAAIHLIRDCTRSMIRKQRGVIVNVSSINAVRGHAGVAVYSATKAGLDGLTRSLAHELGPAGIRINSVAPGFLETEMTKQFTEKQRARIVRNTPLGRLGRVDDVVSVIKFLISPAAAFVTGQVVVVDGGMTC
jgi:3-oxoacyl-[acyl-carrier protein] reductase